MGSINIGSLSIDSINLILFGVIILLSFLLVILFISFIIKKKDPNKALLDLNERLKTFDKEQEVFDQKVLLERKNIKKKVKKDVPTEEDTDPNAEAGTEMLDIDNIVDDMLIGYKNKVCAMVVECKGINFELMSYEEKLSIEKTFAAFMNTLDYPIQIFIQTRTLHYKDNDAVFESQQKKIENELREQMEKLNALETAQEKNSPEIATVLNSIRKKQRIYEYTRQFRAQIELIKKTSAILQNNYYIVLNYFAINPDVNVNTKNQNNLNVIRSELLERSNSIIQSIRKCGVEAYVLNSRQLTELCCSSFLCEDEHLFRLRDMMESGFLKLSSSL